MATISVYTKLFAVTNLCKIMRATVVILLLVVVALAWSNPGMEAFKEYTEGHAEQLLLRETGDTRVGRVLSEVGGSLAGAFVDRVSERDNYLLFSVYSIDLDGEEDAEAEWRFLGVAGQFIEFQKPEEKEDRP